MRFYFPDSQDQIDPLFDFVTEEHPVHRVRQRDDRYAHEVLRERPFDGLLVSKAIVDGRDGAASGRYSTASRHRLYREGVRKFFRLQGEHNDVVTIGDCGAFAYFSEDEPPYDVDEVVDFYEGCQFDEGVAPDHIVFGFVRPGDPAPEADVQEWERRRKVSNHNAALFLERHAARRCSFQPVGVAHGWSRETYAQSVVELQDIGYTRIAMGGMVPLKTPDILLTLEHIAPILDPGTELHLFGITRTEEMNRFSTLGVTSFDSTSPFRQAFKDDKDNYYTIDSTFVALRVPQVDGNATLKRRIKAGQVDQRAAIKAERHCITTLRKYDQGGASTSDALDALDTYNAIVGEKRSYRSAYQRTLEAAPWRTCSCGICEDVGIEVAIFRGSERNKRRGFHNLAVFRKRLNDLGFPSLRT